MQDNINDIIVQIKNNSKEENKKLAEKLKNGLSESQSDALGKLMSDKNLVNKLLQSDEAKKIMNQLGGDKNGHK